VPAQLHFYNSRAEAGEVLPVVTDHLSTNIRKLPPPKLLHPRPLPRGRALSRRS